MDILSVLKHDLEDKVNINLIVAMSLLGVIFYRFGVEEFIWLMFFLPCWYVVYLIVSELYWWKLRK